MNNKLINHPTQYISRLLSATRMKKTKIVSVASPSNKKTQGITGITIIIPQYIPLQVWAKIQIIIVVIKYNDVKTIPIFDFFIIFLLSLNFAQWGGY